MFNTDAFAYVDVLNAAANAKWQRNEILSNNIANVDTPGYKRRDLEFSTCLETELLASGYGADSLDKAVKNMDVSNLQPHIYTEYQNMSYRLDGNNVNIETENVELASNQIEYDALIDSMTHEFNRIKSVLQ
ncbi:MAG: flagellar basal body rod protein FlgB [Lachnospiraceae bacterium]|nr:flagellar basal body rod protein FlgB [Lachnospira sp.]MBR6697339.1 flagellar basal body rod protein FlgB [Lachnospiraceae bacterium]